LDSISQETVETIRSELRAKRVHEWSRLYLELQDDSTFLLVQITLPSGSSREAIDEACGLIKEVVTPRIATTAGHFAWVGGVEIDGKVVESVIGDM